MEEHLSRAADLIKNADLTHSEELITSLTQTQELMKDLVEHLEQLFRNQTILEKGAEETEQWKIREEALLSRVNKLTAALREQEAEEDFHKAQYLAHLERNKRQKDEERKVADLERRIRAFRKNDMIAEIEQAMDALENACAKDEEDLINNKVLQKQFLFFHEANQELKVRLFMKECELQQEEEKWSTAKVKLAQLVEQAERLRAESAEAFCRCNYLMMEEGAAQQEKLREEMEKLNRLMQEETEVLEKLSLVVSPVQEEYKYPTRITMNRKEKKILKKLRKQDAEEGRQKKKAEEKKRKEERKAEKKKAKEEKRKETDRSFWRKCFCLC